MFFLFLCHSLFLFVFLFLWFSPYIHKNKNNEFFEEDDENDEKDNNYLNYAFSDFTNGFFSLGGFMLQWGFTGSGPGGKISNNNKQNPTFSVIAGLTLDMIEHRLGWETNVTLPVEFEEIYGAHCIPYGEKQVVYENIRVAQLHKDSITFRTSSEHSPFLWFAYGLKKK